MRFGFVIIGLGFLLPAGLAHSAENPLPPALPEDIAAQIFEFPELEETQPEATKAASSPVLPAPAQTRAGEAAPTRDALTARVEEAVKQALSAKGAGDSILVEGIRFNRMLSSFTLPAGEKALNVQDVSYDEKSGKFSGKIIEPGQPELLFRGQYYSMREIPVFVRRMKRGEVVAASDVVVREVAEKRVRPDTYLLAEDKIVGQTLRRTLAGGHPIRRTDLDLPVAVEAGQEVNLIFRSGAMRLSDRGLAVDKGSIGDVIRVKNVKSGQMLRARVESPQDVLVNYLDAPAPREVAQAGDAHETR